MHDRHGGVQPLSAVMLEDLLPERGVIPFQNGIPGSNRDPSGRSSARGANAALTSSLRGAKRGSNPSDGNHKKMDCRVGLRPPRNDECFTRHCERSEAIQRPRVGRMLPSPRPCEEQSDEAIHLNGNHPKMDGHIAFGSSQGRWEDAPLAMTARSLTPPAPCAGKNRSARRQRSRSHVCSCGAARSCPPLRGS